MSFEPRSFDQIVTELQRRSAPAITDFEVGSVARTLYESFAYEIGLLYEKMNLVYLSAFVDTAEGQQLDMVVAVLGIRRGQPDYATGSVSFQRDVGNEDIEIPINTLISTEEAENKPSKFYQTVEPAVLLKDTITLDVKVQALEPGEALATEPQTITVMPRPIPGVKSVVNREAIRFTGKRRETDDELRTRAKNALIASGKSTVVSLEDGLLSLPKVKDVKVRENFQFARGQVKVALTEANQPKIIEKHYRLIATEENITKNFEVTNNVKIAANGSEFVNIQALNQEEAGEVRAGQQPSWTMTDRDGNPIDGISITNPEPIVRRDFGVVEIFVDGIDFTDQTEVSRVRAEIERLRAAGVFVMLNSVTPVTVAGVFRIELNESLRLPSEDRARLEGQVADAIRKYISERRMGQPLVIGQVIKNALSVQGVESLDDFSVTITRNKVPITKDGTFKREEVEEFERIYAGYICVASEIKALPIGIQFLATDLNEQSYSDAVAALQDYFKTFEVGKADSQIVKQDIIEVLKAKTGGLAERMVRLIPQPWCEREPYMGDNVAVSFVEQPQVGDIFGYSSLLEITGAVRLTLPPNLSDGDKTKVATQVQALIDNYLDMLKPEADIEFVRIIQLAQQVPSVLAVDINPDDFVVSRAGRDVDGRVSRDKIDVGSFEKPIGPYLCVTSGIETVQIGLAALEINATASADSNDSRDVKTVIADAEKALLEALRSAYSNFLAQPEAGKSVSYAAFRRAMQVSVPNISYTIETFSLVANSTIDGRSQITPLEQDGASLERDILVRSVEIASLLPFDATVVKFNTVTTLVKLEEVTVEATDIQVAATVRPTSDDSKAKTDAKLKSDTQTLVKQAIMGSFNNLPSPEAGQPVSIATLKQTLVTPLNEVTYVVTKLGLKATSARDNRVQETPQTLDDIAVDQDIDVRAGEVAVYKTLRASKITVTVTVQRSA